MRSFSTHQVSQPAPAAAARATTPPNHPSAQQLTTLQSQLAAATADRASLAAHAEAVATAHADLTQQMAALGAERESLAQQNAALAAALGDKLAGVAAAGEAHTGLAAAQQQQQGLAAEGQQQQQPGQPSPAQLRELGALLQRLTRENASLIKAR